VDFSDVVRYVEEVEHAPPGELGVVVWEIG